MTSHDGLGNLSLEVLDMCSNYLLKLMKKHYHSTLHLCFYDLLEWHFQNLLYALLSIQLH